jgi:hypothetical protein
LWSDQGSEEAKKHRLDRKNKEAEKMLVASMGVIGGFLTQVNSGFQPRYAEVLRLFFLYLLQIIEWSAL